jgi:beta-carotene/zeaxanthin 4-ketolase
MAVAAGLMLLAPPLHVLMFWMLPALLASLQLFTFGTWLPHRPGRPGFVDQHCARSSGYGYLRSLLICFHFGYHQEHHAHPSVPWWRLPQQHQRAKQPSVGASTAPGGQAPWQAPNPHANSATSSSQRRV